jgi:ERF superfamily
MTQASEVILSVMQEVQGLAKRDKNTHQNFNFRGIDAVMNVTGPALRRAGGYIVPTVVDKSAEIMNGKLNLVRLTVSFSVYGSEGDPITGTVAAEAFDSGDKATAKAMSVAYRTFLLQLLCLPTDEPDPDSYSYNIEDHAKAAPTKARDWTAETNALTDVEAARQLYNEARTRKAGNDVLDAIKTKVASFGPASK